MKKAILLFIASISIFLPLLTHAADNDAPRNETFKALVVKVAEERKVTREDGTVDVQQNLLLLALDGKYKGQQLESHGIGDFDIVAQEAYQAGDKVYVDIIRTDDGRDQFFVVDYVRTGWIYLLAAIFIIITVVVGGRKGWRSLLSLLLSIAIVLLVVVPFIIKGFNPLVVAVGGSLLIMMAIIYLTDGYNRKSHLAIITVFFSLALTVLLAWLFTELTRLSGFSSEEATLLIGTSVGSINFRGLLLAGMLIGAVGVLDDIILGQIEAVDQINQANPKLKPGRVFKSAMEIGKTHLGAIINTLFLTYVGVALPLLILFYVNSSGLSLLQIINNDVIATEIVRTLVGSVGLMVSMPIATWLASRYLKK